MFSSSATRNCLKLVHSKNYFNRTEIYCLAAIQNVVNSNKVL